MSATHSRMGMDVRDFLSARKGHLNEDRSGGVNQVFGAIWHVGQEQLHVDARRDQILVEVQSGKAVWWVPPSTYGRGVRRIKSPLVV